MSGYIRQDKIFYYDLIYDTYIWVYMVTKINNNPPPTHTHTHTHTHTFAYTSYFLHINHQLTYNQNLGIYNIDAVIWPYDSHVAMWQITCMYIIVISA